jgi:hypothetical protein
MAITSVHKLILNQLNDYIPSFRKGQIATSDGGDIQLGDLIEGAAGDLITVAASGGDTMSREENVAGLSSAITLAEAVRVTMNAHAADGVEHGTSADATNFPLVSPTATNLASLLVLAGEMLTSYAAHNADAQLGAAWVFHNAQQAGNDLVSAVTPTTLEEAVTRLNDLKAKYNSHESSAVSHTVGSAHTETTADAAYGAANLVPVSGVLAGDTVSWAILDSGTGTVTGVSAVASAGGVTFTFSADPQNDAIISYTVYRTATV